MLSELVHVKHDRAFECPVAEGALLPPDLPLHPLPAEPDTAEVATGAGAEAWATAAAGGATSSLDALVHAAAGGRATVLLCGSWS